MKVCVLKETTLLIPKKLQLFIKKLKSYARLHRRSQIAKILLSFGQLSIMELFHLGDLDRKPSLRFMGAGLRSHPDNADCHTWVHEKLMIGLRILKDRLKLKRIGL